jgi:hypothetical protein
MFNTLTGFTYRGLAPHKPFGLELRAERFTPPDKLGIFDMPGVHNCIHRIADKSGSR